MHAAEGLGMPYGQVFKTLVTKGTKGGYIVFVIPCNALLDRKLAAKAAGEKSVELIPVKDLLAVTGYVRGGCSPVGMKKRFPTYLDESVLSCDEVAVSAGMRGEQLILAPADLIRLTNAKVVSLIEEERLS
jgi:Cys-tRNA(Pro)/Cys-tRNA(Cys) deacylase